MREHLTYGIYSRNVAFIIIVIYFILFYKYCFSTDYYLTNPTRNFTKQKKHTQFSKQSQILTNPSDKPQESDKSQWKKPR